MAADSSQRGTFEIAPAGSPDAYPTYLAWTSRRMATRKTPGRSAEDAGRRSAALAPGLLGPTIVRHSLNRLGSSYLHLASAAAECETRESAAQVPLGASALAYSDLRRPGVKRHGDCSFLEVSASGAVRSLGQVTLGRWAGVRNAKGFTLIELLIVVVIIGVLASIAIPKFANTKDKAYIAAMKSDLRNLVTAQEAYFSDYVTYASTTTNLVYSVSSGDVVTVTSATGKGWAATSRNNATTKTCGIFVGSATPPITGQAEGSPVCQ
jgi:prepilin-type N-terminal cleavage/methylation domain-containing protein